MLMLIKCLIKFTRVFILCHKTLGCHHLNITIFE